MSDDETTLAEMIPIRYQSLAAMRAVHAELITSRRESGAMPDLERIAMFIRRGKATGALLDSHSDRRGAQSMLDYWDNVLQREGHNTIDPTLQEFDPLLAPELDDSHCPYLGLDAFRESNQDVFFGRQRLVTFFASHLQDNRLLAVVGPSGAGKSSVVLAGLLPRLKAGAMDGSEDWHYFATLLPGSNPLLNLARTIRPPGVNASAWARQQAEALQRDARQLTCLVNEYVAKPAVLVIDQFEEIFTLCLDDNVRQAFVDSLIHFIQAEEHRHIVILTMRADFESHMTRLPAFQPLFEQALTRVTPLNASELRDAIEKPAELVGLKFAEGVVEALLQDILGEPAALPLLQFTLLKLWEMRERNRVTWEAYQCLGGGRLALANSADEFYDSLIPEEQVTARRILLRMVRPGDGVEVTRNRIRRQTLYHAGESPDRVNRVLDKLIGARLVRQTPGETPNDTQVEVTHEALVRNWPKLVGWLEDEADNMRRRLRLTAAAEHWESLNRDPSALWRGKLLDEAAQFDDLNELEVEFVRSSQAAAEQEEREREEARQRELAQARALAEEQKQRAEAQAVAARRLRYFSYALVALMVLIGVGSFFGINFAQVYSGLKADVAAVAAEAELFASQVTQEAKSAQETVEAGNTRAAAAFEAEQTRTAATSQAGYSTATAEVATSQAQNAARATEAAQATATAFGATATVQRATAQAEAARATAAAMRTPTAAATEPGPTATPDPDVLMEQFRLAAQAESIVRTKDNMPMLFITGDTFMMGAAADAPDAGEDEKPLHRVTLDSYYLDQFEVSAQQFAAFLNDMGGYRRMCDGGRFDCVKTGLETTHTYLLNNFGIYEAKAGFASYPVNWVSWYGAHDYCEWARARLPTEAEWEYAARGIDGRLYPWTNEPPSANRAVFGKLPTGVGFLSALKPVDALPDGASPFGAQGMAGSVWEWVQDWYDPAYYATNPGAVPNENDSGLKVLRGGSWESPTAQLRTTTRYSLPPRIASTSNLVYWGVGFRCARDANSP